MEVEQGASSSTVKDGMVAPYSYVQRTKSIRGPQGPRLDHTVRVLIVLQGRLQTRRYKRSSEDLIQMCIGTTMQSCCVWQSDHGRETKLLYQQAPMTFPIGWA